MQHSFSLNDMVLLWGDADKEPMKIIGITHYPHEQEPIYELWATEGNCLVRGTFNKHHLIPINE